MRSGPHRCRWLRPLACCCLSWLLAAALPAPTAAAALPKSGADAAALPVLDAHPATVQAPPGATASPDLPTLKRTLAQYLQGQPGTWGVAVIDLRSGARFGIREGRIYAAASTYKLPVAMYILEQVAQRRAALDERIVYTPADFDPGDGVLHATPPGKAYTVRTLIDLMIRHSDNIARNMLLRRFGAGPILAYARRRAGGARLLDPETPGTTPAEMARLLEHLYHGAIPDEELSRWLLDLLMTTRFDSRIAAGVPRGVRVAHKVGTRPRQVHDVGLVLAPDRPFALAIYSEGVKEEEAERVIATITRIVYWRMEAK